MVIVAGITRSGLTMVMQMLEAGGMPCHGEWPAFEPSEIGCIPWHQLDGKAVKLVDAHMHAPYGDVPPFQVIRLQRDRREQVKSICKFLDAVASPLLTAGVDQKAMGKQIKRDYRVIDDWARRHPNMTLRFEDVIRDPLKAAIGLKHFVRADLDHRKMAMAVMDRSPRCHERLLELEMIGESNVTDRTNSREQRHSRRTDC